MHILAEAALPPTGLAVLALALLLGGRRRSAVIALACLVVLSTDGAARLLFGALALPAPRATSAPGAIVILPADTPGLLDPSRTPPDIETLERLRTGAILARQTGLPILVSGGRAAEGPVPVAAAMASSLRDDFRIEIRWEESQSRTLAESAARSAALLRAAGIRQVFLVTQPWDIRLASLLFRDAGIEAVPAAVRHPDPLTVDRSMLLVFTPAWLDSALALRQWAALAYRAIKSDPN